MPGKKFGFLLALTFVLVSAVFVSRYCGINLRDCDVGCQLFALRDCNRCDYDHCAVGDYDRCGLCATVSGYYCDLYR